MNGTSMAAPHVAGAVALLWSANPALIGDYDATYRLLVETAQPRTDDAFDADRYTHCHADSVPNNIYGYGLLDTYAAIAEARVDIPWLSLPQQFDPVAAGDTATLTIQIDARAIPKPGSYSARILVGTGDLSQTPLPVEVMLTVAPSSELATVTGTVRDTFNGAPLVGTVEVNNHLRLVLDEEGSFRALLQPSQKLYVFQTNVQGYVNQSERLLLEAGGEYTLDFVLDGDMPVLDIVQPLAPGSNEPPAITTALSLGRQNIYRIGVRNSGSQPLDFTASVPFEPYSIWHSDEPDGPDNNWINMPLDETNPVTLTTNSAFGPIELDPPFVFNGVARDKLYVSANGMLSFEVLPFNPIPPRSCLPAMEAFATAIAPMRTDLDPSAGGKVHWAAIEEGFLITFEDVPVVDAHTIHLDPDVTFQVLLAHDGRIVYNYGQLDTVPHNVAVGMQYDEETVQLVGCGKDTPISTKMSIEFRPQANPEHWIDLPDTTGAVVLQPGEQTSLSVELRATSIGHYQPYRSAVVFTSNDLRRPTVRLPVALTTYPSPNVVWMPLFKIRQ
jgi:hypothetical protein